MLRCFDRLVRALFFFTVTPLSEHSVGERAGAKVAAELQHLSHLPEARVTANFFSLLQYFCVAMYTLLLVSVALSLVF